MKDTRILLAILLLGLIACTVWIVLRQPSEPVYQGKPLSEWLRGYDKVAWIRLADGTIGKEPDVAIRAIGTNGIPILLRMIQAKDSAWILRILKLAKRQHLIKFTHVLAEIKNTESEEAFRALGASASNAVPELLRIYDSNDSPGQRSSIVDSLGYIGPEARSAVSALVAAVVNTNKFVWDRALWALGQIHSEPKIVVPLLTSFLHSPDMVARVYATQGLGMFRADAIPAMAALLESCEDSDWHVAEMAVRSLGEIYSKAEWLEYLRSHLHDPPGPPIARNRTSILVGIIHDFGAMGTNGQESIPALVKFLGDPDEGVRISATNALKAIDPEASAKAGVR